MTPRPHSDNPRDQQRPIRFTKDELDLIERAARKEGVKFAAFVRECAVGVAKRLS